VIVEAEGSKLTMKGGLTLRGLREILLPRPKDEESLDVVFGPAPETAASKRGRDLPDFLRQVTLFEELGPADLKRLAQIAHERSYRDGETIYEQGKPGLALFLLRSGIVEISRRKRNGDQLPLAMLEPPASFEELAAMGCDVVRWSSARAHGPVILVALGRPDLDVLSHTSPAIANKILRKLSEITARRLQLLVESQYLDSQAVDTAVPVEAPSNEAK
jgi:CRP/FNR family cyclic AMP-dependent transcriptional regulator